MSQGERAVVVTGIGLQTCLGNTPDSFFKTLMAGISKLRRHPELPPTCAAGWIDFQPERFFTKLQLLGLDRVSQLAIIAAGDAVHAADLTLEDTERCGVFFGTGLGGAATIEQSYAAFFRAGGTRRPLTVPIAMNHAPASQIGIKHKIYGECQTYSTACSSSSVAIGEAYRRIKDGYLDQALAGGAECMLRPGVVGEWETLRVLATANGEPSTACRPFSKGRTGFHLAEGACVLVLEERTQAIARGALILAEVAGFGVSNDATHITKPDELGQSLAMERALGDAGIEPRDVDAINAHGTATLAGDAVETHSIKRVFGEHAHRIPVSATKSAHGHAIGATGAIELAASILALRYRAIPPTAFWLARDPDCDLDYVPGKGRTADHLRTVMSNSFAFGGNNAVLIVRAA